MKLLGGLAPSPRQSEFHRGGVYVKRRKYRARTFLRKAGIVSEDVSLTKDF